MRHANRIGRSSNADNSLVILFKKKNGLVNSKNNSFLRLFLALFTVSCCPLHSALGKGQRRNELSSLREHGESLNFSTCLQERPRC